MKKKSTILLTWIYISILICISIVSFSACSINDVGSSNGDAYEEKLLGTWVSQSGKNTIMYVFEKDSNGQYTASVITSSGGTPDIYSFDKFSASKRVITLNQNGKQTKWNYFFEDEYLYIEDLEFEKFK